MPQQNMSSKIGTSSSALHQKVIDKAKDGQQPCGAAAQAVAGAYNKQPVKK